jgi:hypothetical protein
LNTKYTIKSLSDFETKPDGSMEVWGEDVSDGYHTMKELYEHRYRLYLALVKIYDNYITPYGCNIVCWKSKRHDDGTMFEGDFILGMTVTKPQFKADEPAEKFYITYHLPLKHWHLANVIELPRAPQYDGHTPNDVLERLLRL